MEHTSTDEDPGLATLADRYKARFVDFVLSELCEAARDFMKAKKNVRSRTQQLTLTPARAPRRGFSRKTEPIPVIKEVWFVGVLLHEGSLPMAIYIGLDGTPYCAYYLRGTGEQRVEITEDLLLGLSEETLDDMVGTIKEKRSALELLTSID